MAAPTKPFIPKSSVSLAKNGDTLPATPAMGTWMELVTNQANAGGGAVTAVTATAPIASSGGATPNITHNVSGVTAATYGDATHVAQVAVNVTGHVTSASNVAITFPAGGITELTGDVTAGPGSGSQAATIANNAVSNSKLRDSAAVSVIGRSANSSGDPADIAASADNDILGRRSSVVGFTAITAYGYWSPLTNGDPVTPELIFDGSGDTIAVWTAT